MDDYFPSIALFERLWEIELGACGTARVNWKANLLTLTISVPTYEGMRFLVVQLAQVVLFSPVMIPVTLVNTRSR